jgi:flagella basal body P-ring formation protein FlgA
MKYLLFILFGIQILAQSLEQDAVNYFKKQFPEYEKIELQLQKNSSLNEKMVIDYTRRINLERGTALIPVIKTKNGSETQSIVLAKVKLFKKILVTLRNIEKKDPLTKNDFEEKLIDVTSLNGNPIQAKFNLDGYRAKVFLRKGEILFEEKIEKTPLVNVGDKVIAEVKKGTVVVTTEVYARQCGSKGDLIEVVSTKNKIIKARVVNAKKVMIE